jgi:hypothetical protein
MRQRLQARASRRLGRDLDSGYSFVTEPHGTPRWS